MDKDRVAGSAKQVKGTIKELVGKAIGDAKLASEGKADKVDGKIQNAVRSMAGSIWCRSAVNFSFFRCCAACRTRSSACDTLTRSCARRVLC